MQLQLIHLLLDNKRMQRDGSYLAAPDLRRSAEIKMNELTKEQISEIAHMICDIARDYVRYGIRNDSKILDACEYQFIKDQIDRSDIEEELRCDPSLVADWMQWSEDKRCSPAWYLKEKGGTFYVGYYHNDFEKRTQTAFDDGIQACAEFIMQEINDK
jgi:hypothetical protein